MSVPSNLFVCDALDLPSTIEHGLYSNMIRFESDIIHGILNDDNIRKKALAVFYLCILSGDEKYIKMMSLLGQVQETIFCTIADLLDIGSCLRQPVLKNLVAYITTFYPHIIHFSSCSTNLIRAIFQYSTLFCNQKGESFTLISLLIHVIRQTAQINSDNIETTGMISYILGRIFVEHHSQFKDDLEYFSSFLELKTIQNQIYGRELVRSCLELSDTFYFKKHLSSDHCHKWASSISNQHHVQLRIPSFFWSQVTFILDNVEQDQSPEYLKMLGFDTFSEEFLVDLIRAIICCYHPPNKILASGNIQRWFLIWSIIRTFKNPSSVASAKLAIFIDWFFDTDDFRRNVMLFEPGCLLISRSGSDVVKLSLIEFLFLCGKEFSPSYPTKIRIAEVFRKLVELGVIKWKDIALPKSSPTVLVNYLSEIQEVSKSSSPTFSAETTREVTRDAFSTKSYLKELMKDLENRKRAFIFKHQ